MAYIALGLLVLGIIFLLIEIFMPGFGVFGVIGLVGVILSAVITIVSVPNGVVIVLSGVVILAVLGYLLIEFAKKHGFYGKIILEETLNDDENKTPQLTALIEQKGVVKTPLKPYGTVDFNGTVTEAYSDGEFIPAGQQVVAYKVYASNLYVKKI